MIEEGDGGRMVLLEGGMREEEGRVQPSSLFQEVFYASRSSTAESATDKR